MPDFYQIAQGGQPHGRPPVPPQHPVPQGGHQPSAPMGFQQSRSSRQIAQQQSVRPMLQSAIRFPQHRPHSDFGSPQSRRSYSSFHNQNRAPRPHDDIIPDEFGRFVEVSDLTAANFTEEQYYQYLSTPIAIRFEKIEPQHKYDSAGDRVKSTWLNCTRTLLPNFDAAQASHEIQRLNRKDKKKGSTLIKKNLSLGSNAQTQVKQAERDLSAAVLDRRFRIVLKQLDWTEKSIAKQHGAGSKHHSREKPRKERVAITAYFSRCPKLNQVPSSLYQQLEMEKSQGQAELHQYRQERELTAHRVREDQAREVREHEEKMAMNKVRQEEAIANRIHEERMMSQHEQQKSMSQQMPPGQPMHQSHQMPHPQGRPPMHPHQPGPGPYGRTLGPPAMARQQSGPLPQGYVQGHPPMAHHPRPVPVPQQHPHFQPNNGHQQGRPQQPPIGQGMPPQGFRQMAPQQGQQGPPQPFRQMPPHPQRGAFVGGPNGEFIRQPINGSRPTITVVTEHDKDPKHMRMHASASSGSSADSHSGFGSDSDRYSASTKSSSLTSGATGSLHMGRAMPTKPKKPNSGGGLGYIVDTDDDFVRNDCPPTMRRHSMARDTAYIQTGSERKIKVPELSRRSQAVDSLTQVREAYLAGHADHERLVSEVERLDASARKYQPHRRLSRSETFSEADRLKTLPRKYHLRRLSRSNSRSGHWPKIVQDNELPQVRRVTTSEVGRELDRERAQDFGGDFSQRLRTGAKVRDLRYDEGGLERDFAARVRINDGRLNNPCFPYDGGDLDMLRERQRQRESLARNEHENILRGIGENGRRQSLRTPEWDLYVDAPSRSHESRFEGRAGFGPRAWA